MTFDEFVAELINEQTQASSIKYTGMRLKGSLDGLAACKQFMTYGEPIQQAIDLYSTSIDAVEFAEANEPHAVDYYRHYAAEVKWICECATVVLHNQGLKGIVPFPSLDANKRVADLVGISDSEY